MQSLYDRGRARLEAAGSAVVSRLGGVWRAGGGMCLCPVHNDRRPSLSVRVGERALLFKCFAGCDTQSIIAELRRLDRDVLRRIDTGVPEQQRYGGNDGHRLRALRLWNEAVPLAGTCAEEYLRRRRITLLPKALRYHPQTPIRLGNALELRPAMIAALHDGGDTSFGRFVAVQRTFLERSGACRARDLDDPKMILGRPLSGAVILAEATTILGLAEGVETALSAMMLFDIPVWAALGSSRLAQVAIPQKVNHLVLFADSDPAGRIGAASAAEAYGVPGRTIETLYPPEVCKDWNDVLRSGGEGVGDWWRKKA